ncbi:hypothetical protein XAC2852_380087 [Xanthomonas citri pv. citri]|nr:hypothetical protein XAC2852_380087 [Xanthomonas citri pv. citri]
MPTMAVLDASAGCGTQHMVQGTDRRTAALSRTGCSAELAGSRNASLLELWARQKAANGRLAPRHQNRLLHAVGNTTLGQVVGSHLNFDPVAGQDADVVLAHTAGDVGDDFMPVLQLDPERGVGKRLADAAFEFNGVVFRHVILCNHGWPGRAVRDGILRAISPWCKFYVKRASPSELAGRCP